MRKQTKLVAVLSAAALLAIGASMTSMAAQGWQQEGDDWYYYDNNGDAVTDDWKKSGNNWYYLGDEGYMMKNFLLEDGDNVYYLDGNGVMVTNAWVAVAPSDDDYEDDAPDHYWYYFQSNGRAVKASDGIKKRDINGKTYGFDEDGKMLYGFVDENGDKLTDENPFMDAMYYFGDSDDGAMTKGWLQYMDGSDESAAIGWTKDYDDLTELWFYFNPSNGKLTKSTDSEPKTKTINGNKYAFDENGVMISSWSVDTATQSKYYNEDTQGWLSKNKWIWAIPDESINESDYNDDTYRWFYADGSGKAVTNQLKKIGGKKYLFDSVGRMKSGLVTLNNNEKLVKAIDADETKGTDLIQGNFVDSDGNPDSVRANGVYYFGDEATDGSMKTGKSIKVEMSDDTYTFGFAKDGKGYNSIESNKLYVNGVLVSADSDYKYQVVSEADVETPMGDTLTNAIIDDSAFELNATDYDNHNNFVVGTSGAIVKPGKYVKDSDGNYFAVADKNDNGTDEGTIAFFKDSDDAKNMAKDWAEYGKLNDVTDADRKVTNGYDEDGDYVSCFTKNCQ